VTQARSGGSTRRRGRRLAGVGIAALVFALSTGVAHAVFGSLTFVEQDKDGVGGVDGLRGASGVAASPDGAHVYVTGLLDDAVATFSRNASTGALSFVEQDKDGVGGVEGLDAAAGVAASPDGAHVYVAGVNDDAVATFSRDPATGALTFVELDKDGVGGIEGLDGALGIAAPPDGAHVYVTGAVDDAVATFSRDPATGALSFVEQDKDGIAGVDGLDNAVRIAASPDGAHVYVTGREDDSVATFSREGPPAPPAVGAPAPRTITFDASKSKAKKSARDPLLAVRKGRKVRFSGDVSAPQDVAGCESNQTVELQRKKPKQAGFTTFDQLQTDATGNFSTKEKIKKTFEYRAVLVETAACDDAASPTEKVKAKKRTKQ
jgi:6-phosphogluconolactonase (cycloisomerase 2 family)